MEANINFDGLFVKNVAYSSNALIITIFLCNTGDEPAYDVCLTDSPLPLSPNPPNQIIYSFASYMKIAANETRHMVSMSPSCGISLGQINPNDIIEATIIYANVNELPVGSADIATVKYTTHSKIKYGKSNIFIYNP